MKERDSEGNKFPIQLMTILFNQSFPEYPDRTMDAIKNKRSKLLSAKQRERHADRKKDAEYDKPIEAQIKVDVKPAKVKVSPSKKKARGKQAHRSAKHGGMGYTVSEDRYLVENWSPDWTKREKVAKKLGRTVSGCAARLGTIKKKHPDYYLTLVSGNAVQTVNVLPQGTRKDETMLQRLDYWLVNRKAIKQAKKQAKIDKKRVKKEAKLKKKLAKLRGDF